MGWIAGWLGRLGHALRRLIAGEGRFWPRIALGVVVLLAIYYPAGMLYRHVIDDDPHFAVPEGG